MNVDMTTLANLESTPDSQHLFLYGSISCGADTWKVSLGKGKQIFSFDHRLRSSKEFHRTNYFRTNWSKYPALDLLLVQDAEFNKLHQHWMEDWGHPSRARHLLVFHGLNFLTAGGGKGFKAWSKTVRGKGYDTHTWHVNGVHCGSSIYSNHVVTFCYPRDSHLGLPIRLPVDQSVRACRNMIRTYGSFPSPYFPISLMAPIVDPPFPNCVGTL